MPRNISFFLTTDQIRNKTKDVTRRDGWKFLKVGDILNACVKCQGLRKGEKIEKICQIEVLSLQRQRLTKMNKNECIREGFPEMSAIEFINMFCKSHKGVSASSEVTRIEFKYL